MPRDYEKEKAARDARNERTKANRSTVIAQVLAAGGTVDKNGKFSCETCGLIRTCSTRDTVICELSDSVAGVDIYAIPEDEPWLRYTHETLRPVAAWWNTGDEDGEQLGMGSQVERWKKRTGRVA